MRRFDVAIIGGGPAGSACALRCADRGFETILLEKGDRGRHKACAGVTPLVCEDLLNMKLGVKIPPDVLAVPKELGLFYVPPSGRINGGAVRNYKLFNIRRDLFDQWLRDEAERRGAKVLYGSEFTRLVAGEGKGVSAESTDGPMAFEAKYLIGADGAASRVRSQVFQHLQFRMLTVVQESWRATGELGDYFYVFFRDDVSPAYGYVVPKDEWFLIGAGALEGNSVKPTECVTRLRGWLAREFSFRAIRLEGAYVSQIPFDTVPEGCQDIVLVGDAGGFCNPFSGEGIRFAVMSGVIAAEAVELAEQKNMDLASAYEPRVERLGVFQRRAQRLAEGMNDDEKEAFVKAELSRPGVFS